MIGSICKRAMKPILARMFMLMAALTLANGAAVAQVTEIDPDAAIDADLGTPPPVTPPPAESDTTVSADPTTTADTPATQDIDSIPEAGQYQDDDLLSAAEGVFGKGAKGLAGIIEDILKKQGKPNGYIVGREGGGALVVGLRYGSGTLHHKIEGDKPVYWTGPSIGFDAGVNVGSAFVLVYNLYDTEDLYKRYASGEGVAYLVGGFNAAYMRSGDVVLIPIRVGAGVRLGANVGYMKFSKKRKILPF